MTDLAPHLAAFLREYLPNERSFSRHTVQSYTECFRLLVLYAAKQTKVRPCGLKIEHLTVPLLVAFLDSLEKDRNNSVGTRNNRLAAIRSFFRYLEYRVPSCLDLALQVRAIPQKRAGKPLIDWLDRCGGGFPLAAVRRRRFFLRPFPGVHRLPGARPGGAPDAGSLAVRSALHGPRVLSQGSDDTTALARKGWRGPVRPPSGAYSMHKCRNPDFRVINRAVVSIM